MWKPDQLPAGETITPATIELCESAAATQLDHGIIASIQNDYGLNRDEISRILYDLRRAGILYPFLNRRKNGIYAKHQITSYGLHWWHTTGKQDLLDARETQCQAEQAAQHDDELECQLAEQAQAELKGTR